MMYMGEMRCLQGVDTVEYGGARAQGLGLSGGGVQDALAGWADEPSPCSGALVMKVERRVGWL
jgi:hypothetical protein